MDKETNVNITMLDFSRWQKSVCDHLVYNKRSFNSEDYNPDEEREKGRKEK
jgi:hypothetical protein